MNEQLVLQPGNLVTQCGASLRIPSGSQIIWLGSCPGLRHSFCSVFPQDGLECAGSAVAPDVYLMSIPVSFKNYHTKGVHLGNCHGIWLARRSFLSFCYAITDQSTEKLYG